jgi:hypothetical protein
MLPQQNNPSSLIAQLKAQIKANPKPDLEIESTRPRAPEARPIKGVQTDTKRGENQNTVTADIGDGTDAINFMLVAKRCPSELRAGIDCVIGLAGDRVDWFDAEDLDVAARARGSSGELFSHSSGKKWVQRWRKALCEWQQKENIALIECSPGGQDHDGTRHKSRYKVNLLRLAAVAVEEARKESLYQRDPARALELATETVLSNTPVTPSYKPRFRKPNRNEDALLKRNPKTAKTLMLEAASIRAARGEDVSEFFDTWAQEVKAEFLSVHSKEKNQWTRSVNESRGGEAESTGAPMDKSVHHAPPVKREPTSPVDMAYVALDSFSAVGADSFIVTLKDERTGAASKEDYDLRGLFETMPDLIERNSHGEESLIIRPKGGAFIQIDDCGDTERKILEPFSFLVAETSPGSFQSWLALDPETGDAARKLLRERLLTGALRGTSANAKPGGAGRWIGSLNCKREHERADGSFPRVELKNFNYSRIVTVEELEQAGLLAPPCDSLSFTPASSGQICPLPLRKSADGKEPSYQRCEQSVKHSRTGKIDRSGVDALFAVTCFDWGISFDRVVSLLKEYSEKAKRRRDDYAERTAAWAQKQVANRQFT